MILLTHIKNFIWNIFRLIKVASQNREVHWYYLGKNISNCEINPQSKIYGAYQLSNVKINKGTAIGVNANIRNTSIGKFCSIGPNFICGYGLHPINGISTSPVFYSTKNQVGFTYSSIDKYEEHRQITIGNDVFIGMNVTILDGINIGDGAVIGAGAVVSKDIPPYAVAVGCPIQIIKYRFSQEIIDSLIECKWWDQNEDVLRELEQNFFEIEKFLEILKRK